MDQIISAISNPLYFNDFVTFYEGREETVTFSETYDSRWFAGCSDSKPTTILLKCRISGASERIKFTRKNKSEPYLEMRPNAIREENINVTFELKDCFYRRRETRSERYGSTFPRVEFRHLTNDR
jgi:hypothetical protein